jgi:hypothetical protein
MAIMIRAYVKSKRVFPHSVYITDPLALCATTSTAIRDRDTTQCILICNLEQDV